MRAIVLCLALICLLVPVTAYSQDILYDNGVVCPSRCWDAWQINDGFVVSDTFTLTGNSTVTGFNLWLWEFPGDRVGSVDWSITSNEFGGTTYGSGTARVSDTFIAVNEWGFDIDQVTASGLHVDLNAGMYWFTIQNAVTSTGDPVYWDENSGVGCTSPGCPSLASENEIGTIPSETFNIVGTPSSGTTPEPGTIGLLASGILVGGLIRRR